MSSRNRPKVMAGSFRGDVEAIIAFAKNAVKVRKLRG